jgi:hypothetical protein
MKSKTLFSTLNTTLRRVLSSARGRKTKYRKGGILYKAKAVLSERFSFRLLEGEGTASWRFDKHSRYNVISFYTGIKEMFSVPAWDDTKLRFNGLKQVLRHEIGHALYTKVMRSETFIDRLKKEGIPFPLFNVFEDCRIEFLLWKDFPEDGLFYWHKYMEKLDESASPAMSLLMLKVREAGQRVKRSKTLKTPYYFPKAKHLKYAFPEKTYSLHKKSVCDFYDTVLRLGDTDEEGMIKLLKEWIKLYGKETPSSPSDGVSGTPEGVSKDGEAKAEDEGSEREAGDHSETVEGSESIKSGLGGFHVAPESIVSTADVAFSKRLFSQMLPIIKRACLSPEEIGRRGKLYLKRAIAGFADCFRSSVPANGKRKIYLLIDMSGSMCTDWNMGLSAVASCFAQLRDAGMIELKCFLTKGESRGKHFLADVSDLSAKGFFRLNPDGGAEMIKASLDLTKIHLMEADCSFIITDADITDTPIDPDAWRRQGIDLVGVCTASGERETAMKREWMDKHFSRSFISESPSMLCRRMLDYALKQKVKR